MQLSLQPQRRILELDEANQKMIEKCLGATPKFNPINCKKAVLAAATAHVFHQKNQKKVHLSNKNEIILIYSRIPRALVVGHFERAATLIV